MGTSVQVTPLSGVYNENPLSYLVSIDGFNILIDCGWNDAFDTSLLKPLSSVASTVDAVLLSHSDILHLGALPYAKQHLGLTAQVYSTDPVHRLGLLTMYDHCYSQKQVSGFDLFSLDDIDFAFQSIETVKYSQNHHPTGKIKNTLEGGGNILLPVDTAGRVLELLLVMEQYWALNHLPYPIYFLTYVSSSTIEYAKSFLEWMSDLIAKSFEDTRDNAFLLKHVTLMINKSELDKVPEGPKVVLASMASLEVGSSHDIFAEWATDVKNLVLFTERGQFGTLARMLQADPPPRAVNVTMRNRVPLVGEDKEEDIKASNGSDVKEDDPMVIDASNAPASSELTVPHGGPHRDIFIDGFVPSSTSVAPMFPFMKTLLNGMIFGEIINPDDYVIKEEDMDLMSMHVGGDLDGKLDEVAANLILDSRPSKIVSNELTVQVKCSLVYMDFEGRSDGRSIKSILSHAVLVHGSAEATEHLKQHCLKNVCPHVYAPQVGETIDVTSDLCAYKVQLSEKLMSKVLFKKLGDHEVAWIDSGVEKTETEMLSLRPISTAPPLHKSVFVGDLKLADFKQFLASKGVQVEFSGVLLRCGEYVTLRKVGDAAQKGGTGGTQQVIIEGPLTEEYYQIRDYLYSQFYLL
ncbi:hypothetical protein MKW92_034065 [Papaver armeniacum]|nr:hypothetical protein MKW92_034065 [Papaver armeniacum]